MLNKQKLFFFIPDLNGGGAERALINLLKNWPSDDRTAHAPVLVVRRWQGEYTGEIPDRIERIVLGTGRSGPTATIATVLGLGRELRRHRPDVVVSFLSAPAVYLAARLFHPSCKVVLSLQTSPAQWLVNEQSIGRRLVAMIQGFVFRHADFLLPISGGIAGELCTLYGLKADTIRVIHNSVDLVTINQQAHGPCPPELSVPEGTVRIITAGRLVRQKTQEVLIEAVARVAGQGRKVELFILGQGPDLAFLQETAARLGIGQAVRFLGFQSNPWRFLHHADIFALSSRFEGFANVLIEAMACGLPVVSTDAPHGPAEILADGEHGLLVPVGDSAALADALLQLVDDEKLRSDYSRKSLARAADFDVSGIGDMFRKTLGEIVTGTGRQ